MIRKNKIILGLLLIVIVGIILAYSLNFNNIQNISNESTNGNNSSLNDTKNIHNNSTVLENNDSYNEINESFSNNVKYSKNIKNNKIENNKGNIKSINSSTNNQTSILTKREAYNIAKKAVAEYNPGDTSYRISYSEAKFYVDGDIKYWEFPVSDKVTKEVGLYVCVDVETRGHWGRSAKRF